VLINSIQGKSSILPFRAKRSSKGPRSPCGHSSARKNAGALRQDHVAAHTQGHIRGFYEKQFYTKEVFVEWENRKSLVSVIYLRLQNSALQYSFSILYKSIFFVIILIFVIKNYYKIQNRILIF
jgi:hypothetical protein